MPHIDPRREHRRAKMLDLANSSVKGNRSNRIRRVYRRAVKENRRCRRHEGRPYLRDFRCSGDVECECPGCSYDSWPRNDRWASMQGRPYPVDYYDRVGVLQMVDALGGVMRSGEKWAYRLGSSDELFSWLKRNYPDTLAGRHAIDHIMTTLDVIVGCICNIIGRGSVAKGNHGQCTCGAFLYPIPY